MRGATGARSVEGMKKIALLIVLVAVAPSFSGCAAIVSNLPNVIAAVQDGELIVDAIKEFADLYFVQHPDAAKQAEVMKAVAKARVALDAALRLADGAGKLDQAQIDAAFADFRVAYQDLTSLVGPLGVSVQGQRLARAGAGLVVPEPLALHLRAR